MKKHLFLLTVFCLYFTNSAFAQTYSGGSGTQSSPFLLSSKANMESLAEAVNNGNTYADTYFLLTKNLTSEADIITTIIGDSESTYFSGIFDGGEYEVTLNSYGLFGYVVDGEIKNISVSGTIKNIDSPYKNIGGICRVVEAKNKSVNLTNCINEINIKDENSSSPTTAGGICGYINTSDNHSVTISKCLNKGDITLIGGKDSYGYYTPSPKYSGGICGDISSSSKVTITNCHNTGNITSTKTAFSYAGGICGGFLSASENSKIAKCYNIGTISAVAYSARRIEISEAYAGGICGISNSPISECYNSNVITAFKEPSGGVYSFAGGICGQSKSDVINCYNTGYIVAENKSTIALFRLGGICGENSNSNISNCYNTGDIFLKTDTGSGLLNALAGICGDVYNNTTIKNCFTANNNFVSNSKNLTKRIASAVFGGEPQNRITNCYALKSILINDENIESSDKNSLQGKDEEFSFFQTQTAIRDDLGWDFDTVWEMSDINSENKGLPILKGMENIIIDMTGIKDETSIISDLRVYPNPTYNIIQYTIDKPANAILYDIYGKLVYEQSCQIGENSINIENYPNGIYFLHITGYKVAKIIKK